MTVIRFSHYNLRASADLIEALRRFYTEVIGLQEGPRPPFDSPGHWLYAGPVDLLHLTVAQEERQAHVSGTFDHVAFACDDLEGTMRRLNAHRWNWRQDEIPGQGVVQLFLRDPAGNGVELNFPGGSQA